MSTCEHNFQKDINGTLVSEKIKVLLWYHLYLWVSILFDKQTARCSLIFSFLVLIPTLSFSWYIICTEFPGLMIPKKMISQQNPNGIDIYKMMVRT